MTGRKEIPITVSFIVALVLLIVSSCRSGNTQIIRNDGSLTLKANKTGNPGFDDSVFVSLGHPQAVKEFYRNNSFQTVWLKNGSLSLKGDSMLNLIRHARYFGLPPEAYHITELQNKIFSQGCNARVDALLSDACLSILHDVALQTNEASADSLDIQILHDVIANGIGNSVRRREPSYTSYHLLKGELKKILDTMEIAHSGIIFSSARLENSNAFEKIQKLEINLARWRHEKASIGDYYVMINIPAFMLYVVKDDSIVMQSKVIVGTTEKQTPELSSTIECIITYPFWNVPRKIAIEEYLPVIQHDSAFLDRNDFDVLDGKGNILNKDSVDWKKFNRKFFPVMLRQREGTENALGVIKFVFDNPYAVFLHDTNAKRLFKSEVRAYSHGCIRMEKAEEFAHYLITGDLNRKSKYLQHFLDQKEKHFVTLNKPIPIYVRYLTADVVKNKLMFYPDLYLKDESVIEKLYKQACAKGL